MGKPNAAGGVGAVGFASSSERKAAAVDKANNVLPGASAIVGFHTMMCPLRSVVPNNGCSLQLGRSIIDENQKINARKKRE
jgi:hypothetical protein